VEGNTIGGAKVGYDTPTATDLGAEVIGVTCTGALPVYPVGTTTLTCTATDGAGNIGTTPLTITVKDTTPPVITVPANITIRGTSSAGAVVTFSPLPSAFDTVKGDITPICSKASGTLFPFGLTTVTCTATDGTNPPSSKSFTVNVVVAYRYSGFFSPVTMGNYDEYGLNLVVNKVPAGRNVPLKFQAFDNLNDHEYDDYDKPYVKVVVESYTLFKSRFKNQLLGKTTLPAGNPCADISRTAVLVPNSTVGKTTALKYAGGQYNIGWQMPPKPKAAGDNCFVAFVQITSPVMDPSPGIVALFVMT
jgi:hypothetical protein